MPSFSPIFFLFLEAYTEHPIHAFYYAEEANNNTMTLTLTSGFDFDLPALKIVHCTIGFYYTRAYTMKVIIKLIP